MAHVRLIKHEAAPKCGSFDVHFADGALQGFSIGMMLRPPLEARANRQRAARGCFDFIRGRARRPRRALDCCDCGAAGFQTSSCCTRSKATSSFFRRMSALSLEANVTLIVNYLTEATRRQVEIGLNAMQETFGLEVIPSTSLLRFDPEDRSANPHS